MSNKPFLSLVALNLVLLTVLAFGSFGPVANAQSSRAGGRYAFVSGVVQNVYPGVVYVIDEANQEIVAVSYNEPDKTFRGVGYRDLKSDIATFQQNR